MARRQESLETAIAALGVVRARLCREPGFGPEVELLGAVTRQLAATSPTQSQSHQSHDGIPPQSHPSPTTESHPSPTPKSVPKPGGTGGTAPRAISESSPQDFKISNEYAILPEESENARAPAGHQSHSPSPTQSHPVPVPRSPTQSQSQRELADAWDGAGGLTTSGVMRTRIGAVVPLLERLAAERGTTALELFRAACQRFKRDSQVRARHLGLAVLLAQLEQWVDDAPEPQPQRASGILPPSTREQVADQLAREPNPEWVDA